MTRNTYILRRSRVLAFLAGCSYGGSLVVVTTELVRLVSDYPPLTIFDSLSFVCLFGLGSMLWREADRLVDVAFSVPAQRESCP